VWEVVFDCGSVPPRVVELRDVTMLELAARIVAARSGEFEFEPFDPSTSGLADDIAGEGLFAEDPLFEPSSLFDDSPSLFDDQPPLFEESSLFGEDSTSLEPPSLFESEEPIFGPGVGGSGRGRGEEETAESGGGSRDRGPGGRWRPATGGR
jgi:hypothetical protein